MPTIEEKFRKLVNSSEPRGARRRQILKYIYEHEGANQFQIALGVYGGDEKKAKNFYKSLRHHLKRFENLKIIHVSNGRERKVCLTDEGKRLCKREKITVLSPSVREFIRVLNNWVLVKPLTSDEENRLYGLLSDRALEVLFAISDDLPLPIPEIERLGGGVEKIARNSKERYFELEPSLDVWRCLKGLWIYEMQLREPPSGVMLGGAQLFQARKLRLKPSGVMLAESCGLEQKFKDLWSFIGKLALKNPVLAELRDHVKIAYSDFKHRAPPSRREKVKEKEGGEKA